MTKLLSSPIATVAVAALVYCGATVAFWKTPTPPPVVSNTSEPDPTKPAPSWDYINPEADQLMAELKAEKATLAKKEQDLNELNARLQSERAEMTLVTQSVRQLQNDFDKNVLRINEEEVANLKKLAKVYADIEPATASKIMLEMDDTAIIKIMVYMKDSETAAIWEALAKNGKDQAKRAAMLSDRLRLAVFRNTNAPAK